MVQKQEQQPIRKEMHICAAQIQDHNPNQENNTVPKQQNHKVTTMNICRDQINQNPHHHENRD